MDFPHITGLMSRGLEERLFTAAALVITGPDTPPFYEGYFGRIGSEEAPATTRGTLFDLASLTKVVATTPLWMRLAARSEAILDRPLTHWFPECPSDKAGISARLLLRHASGLPAWRPYYLLRSGEVPRREFTRAKIFSEPLIWQPGGGTLYSDLGFMLLGFILERETGRPLCEAITAEVYAPIGLERELMFLPRREAAGTQCAPWNAVDRATERDRSAHGRVGAQHAAPVDFQIGRNESEPTHGGLMAKRAQRAAPLREVLEVTPAIAATSADEPPGIVHDYNARALGGVSGHAGVFGSAMGVATIGRELLRGSVGASPMFPRDTLTVFMTSASNIPHTNRVLGFETPAADGSSSCGSRFSPRSFGHTGFTGTSLWVDPDAGLVVTLLTNRVYMGQVDMRIKEFRPRLHHTIRKSV